MSDMLNISLRKEQPVTVAENTIKEEKILIGYQVYANVDSISCWIGSCTDIASLEEIVGEDELITSLEESASEVEIVCLLAALKSTEYKYDFFGKMRTAKKVK